MNISNFLEKLKTRSWVEINEEIRSQYVNPKTGCRDCPITGVVWSETGTAGRPEDAKNLAQAIGLRAQDASAVIVAADKRAAPLRQQLLTACGLA